MALIVPDDVAVNDYLFYYPCESWDDGITEKYTLGAQGVWTGHDWVSVFQLMYIVSIIRLGNTEFAVQIIVNSKFSG